MNNNIRTRFAPSPTGYMHVGGVRTALFAWLLARQKAGQFILRIEDTDQSREVEGSVKHIIDSLDWLGLDYDEGPLPKAQKNNYFQSERLEIYRQYALKLLENGRAYIDPYSQAEIQGFREQATVTKQPFLYRNHRPNNLNTVFAKNQPIRFLSRPQAYQWHDEVMGDMKAGEEAIDDFILIKSDGFPTYNFAHIVDDFEMKITHIIRGQEFLASTPNYLNLYEALEISPPIIASVPPIMNENGNKKLSKRDGAKDILQYREEGYLPEAFINFLASLGWNDGTTKEMFSLKELIQEFSLDRIQKSGARFDEKRLIWLQGLHIRDMDLEKLYRIVSPFNDNPINSHFWPKSAYNNQFDKNYRLKVLKLTQQRLKTFDELDGLSRFFFEDLPVNHDLISNHKQLKKLSSAEIANLLQTSYDEFNKIDDWSFDNIQNALNNLLEITGKKPAELFSLIRIATTESPASPGLADTLELLAKPLSLARIQSHIKSPA